MNKKLIITVLCLSAMTPMMAQNITGRQGDEYQGRTFGVCQCSIIE